MDLINAGGADVPASWGGQIGPNARPFVIVYAYLLGGFTAFEPVGRFQRPTLAHRVFGAISSTMPSGRSARSWPTGASAVTPSGSPR